jgi:hypothetical protein
MGQGVVSGGQASLLHPLLFSLLHLLFHLISILTYIWNIKMHKRIINIPQTSDILWCVKPLSTTFQLYRGRTFMTEFSVKPVYEGNLKMCLSWPVAFIYRFKLYALFTKWWNETALYRQWFVMYRCQLSPVFTVHCRTLQVDCLVVPLLLLY